MDQQPEKRTRAKKPTVPHVLKAMSKIQIYFSQNGIAKTGENLEGEYMFRSIDDVMAAVSVQLAANQIIITPRVTDRVSRQLDGGGRFANFIGSVHAEFDFVSAVDGSQRTLSTVGEAIDSSDKALNKAMTAAFKCAVTIAFCIPTPEALVDGDLTSPGAGKPAAEASASAGAHQESAIRSVIIEGPPVSAGLLAGLKAKMTANNLTGADLRTVFNIGFDQVNINNFAELTEWAEGTPV